MKEIANGDLINSFLLEDQTKLLIRGFDKKYLNNCDQDVLKKIGLGRRKILSVGCGDGSTEEKLLQMGHDVTAIPLDSIIAAIAKGKEIEVLTPDVEQSLDDLSSRKFDYILFLETLQYIAEPEMFLQKFLHILKKNGTIIATFNNISVDHYSKLINSEHFNFTCEKNSNNYENDNYDHFEFSGFNFINDRRAINSWFTNSGLNINQIIYYPLSWKGRVMSIFSDQKAFAKASMFMVVTRLKA